MVATRRGPLTLEVWAPGESLALCTAAVVRAAAEPVAETRTAGCAVVVVLAALAPVPLVWTAGWPVVVD